MDVNILSKLFFMHKDTIYKLPVDAKNNVLIISPHPDDETLGCGGAIVKMLSVGVNITVALLTDGGGGGRNRNISQIRMEEFFSSQKILGYSSLVHINLPDSKLEMHKKELKDKLRGIISAINPTLIFVPYFLDLNPDHMIANITLAEVLKEFNDLTLKIAMYEIWTPITYPNCYINITDEYKKKITAMKCYSSQENYFGIVDKMMALNSLRAGLSMHKKSKYMECYKIFSCEEYLQSIELLEYILKSKNE